MLYFVVCRLEWEGSIRNGSTCLRTLEEEKLGLLQDLASKYFQHFNEFVPKLVRSVESLEGPINSCSIEQDMHSIVDIRRHNGVEQLLPDFYAEDTSNLMKKERRQEVAQFSLFYLYKYSRLGIRYLMLTLETQFRISKLGLGKVRLI